MPSSDSGADGADGAAEPPSRQSNKGSTHSVANGDKKRPGYAASIKTYGVALLS